MSRPEQLAHIERAIALHPRRAWICETRAIYSIDGGSLAVALADLDTAIALADRPGVPPASGVANWHESTNPRGTIRHPIGRIGGIMARRSHPEYALRLTPNSRVNVIKFT